MNRRDFLGTALWPLLALQSGCVGGLQGSAHATPQAGRRPEFSVFDAAVDPDAAEAHVVVALSAPITHTAYIHLRTVNGFGATEARGIEGIHFSKVETVLAFRPGDRLRRTVRIPLAGAAEPGRWFVLRGRRVPGGPPLARNEGRITFVPGGRTEPVDGQRVAPRTPLKEVKTFEMNPSTFAASDSGTRDGRPVWRDRLSHGRWQDRNKELGYYAPAQWEIAEGSLHLKATKPDSPTVVETGGGRRVFEYHASVLTTQMLFSQTYGYFECEARLASAPGTWSAFWLLPEDGRWPPEIDIVEQPRNASFGPGDFATTHHWGTRRDHREAGARILGRHLFRPNLNLGTEFHRYGVDWRENLTVWFFDGVEVMRAPTRVHSPCYILLDVAVGGWGGPPDFTRGRTDMVVHSLEVWQ